MLAAANVLLLRGTVSLPIKCVRVEVATIDDVVNILAEYALGHNQSHHHHINEMLTHFPTLQFGMDVNPKFTGGPSGVEYTMDVSAFELMNVELVHGWLIDTNDTQTFQLVGNKTYNELVEAIITGNDATNEMDRIKKCIQELEVKLNEMEEWIDVAAGREVVVDDVPASETKNMETEPTNSIAENDKQENLVFQKTSTDIHSANHVKLLTNVSESIIVDKWEARDEIEVLKKKYETLSQQAINGAHLNAFLENTSHQLTEFGLQELNTYLANDCLCVFFRNNHFSTLTKSDGKLYTLVTDLGYASVPDVVWEELNAIDGDTEYFNDQFFKPKPRTDHPDDATVISPAQMLRHHGQSEVDLQLAIHLSHQEGRNALDTEERRLLATATEASLLGTNFGNGSEREASSIAGTVVMIPGLNDSTQSAPTTVCVDTGIRNLREDQDALIARQLQAYMELEDTDEASAVLARQLQAEEHKRVESTRQVGRKNGSYQRAATTANDSGCIIS